MATLATPAFSFLGLLLGIRFWVGEALTAFLIARGYQRHGSQTLQPSIVGQRRSTTALSAAFSETCDPSSRRTITSGSKYAASIEPIAGIITLSSEPAVLTS